MRSILATFAAVAIAAAGAAFAINRLVYTYPPTPPVVRASLPHSPSSYLGVFADGSPPSYAPIADFAKVAGVHPNLVGYYSGWAEPFATTFAEAIRAHGVVPFVQIDPTLASVSAIADGAYDDYLRSYADSVRDFGHAVVIGFGHEMNAPVYAWGYGRLPASTFVAAWQHIVTLFHTEGADNVTWLWTLEADGSGTGPIHTWWPGAKYVSWVGIDGYYSDPSDTFANVFGKTIDQVRSFAKKPILLSETAVGPAAGQYPKIGNLFHGLSQYKMLGLVWFDKNQHKDAPYYQDWRIEDSAAAESAFRLDVAELNLVRT
jgi:hypothetical protein